MPTLSGGAFSDSRPMSVKQGGYFRSYWLDIGDAVLTNPKSGTTNVSESYKDRVYNIATTNTFKDIVIPVSAELDRPGPVLLITRVSSNPALVTPDITDRNRWTTLGAGTVDLTVSTSIQSLTRRVTTGSVAAVRTFSAFKTGSLAKHLYDYAESRLVGKTRSDVTCNIFSVFDPANNNFAYNPSCWTYGIDLTCLAAYNNFGWNGEGGTQRHGTLITPKHALFVGHFLPPTGTLFWFVSTNGTVYRRTLIGLHYVAGSGETWIGEFDTAIPVGAPNGITLAKCFTTNLLSKLPVPVGQVLGGYNGTISEMFDYPHGAPSLIINQSRQCGLGGLRQATATRGITPDDASLYYGGLAFSGSYTMFEWGTDAALHSAKQTEFSYSVGYGDSGSPRFAIVNGQAILLTIETGSGGDSPSLEGTFINAVLSTLSGGYTLSTLDISSWPDMTT